MNNRWLFVVFAILVWQMFSLVTNPIFLPPPYAVFIQFFSLFKGTILLDLSSTLLRVLLSVIIASLIGIPIGLLMGYYNNIYKNLEFFVDFFRSLPATALFPLFMLFFGIGDLSKIFIGVWSSSLIFLVNSMYGVKRAKVLRLKSAKVMGIKGFKFFRKILFPEALPEIFTGFRIAISLSLAIMVVVEMFIGTTYGLGQRIINAQAIYNIPEVYSIILLTGLLGYLLNKCFLLIENRFLHWRGK